MDSGNSSSMQSSSGGGDDDFDSRADSLPPPPQLTFFNPMSTPDHPELLPHYPKQHHQPPSSLFDPSTNFNLHHSSTFDDSASSIMLNRDILWPAPLAADNNIGGGDSSSSSRRRLGQFASSSSSSMAPPPPPPPQGNDPAQAAAGPTTSTGPAEASTQTRPKKRTRGSRRAPTTVLATDTNNFRAMVQQYTGIPASPYSAISSSPYPRRLDLIGSPRSWSPGFANPCRPSAHKLQNTTATTTTSTSSPSSSTPLLQFPGVPSESLPSGNISGSNVDAINNFVNFNSNQYESPANPMAFPRMPLNFDTNNVPQLTFQSLLSSHFSPLEYSSAVTTPNTAGAAGFGSRFNEQNLAGGANTSMGLVGVSQDHHGFHSSIGLGSEGTAGPKSHHDHDRQDNGNGGADGRDPLATYGGNYVNCSSTSSSSMHRGDHQVVVENAAASRGEGTLASWINSPS